MKTKQAPEKKSISFEKAFIIVVGLHVFGALALYGVSSLKGYLRKAEREAQRQEIAKAYESSPTDWRKEPVSTIKKIKTLPPSPQKPKQIVASSTPPKPIPPKNPKSTKWITTPVAKSTTIQSNPNGTQVIDVASNIRNAVASTIDSMFTSAEEEKGKERLARALEDLATDKRIRMNKLRQAMRFQNAEEEQQVMALLNEIDSDVITRQVVSSRVVLQ